VGEVLTESRQIKIVIGFKWLYADACCDLNIPGYETSGASGMDVCAALEQAVDLNPGDIEMIPTGFAIDIPVGFEVQVRPRSGLAIKHGITIVNAPGTIDSDYRGEVKIGLINVGRSVFTIKRGDRIAQLVVAAVVKAHIDIVESLSSSKRGVGGFGHTGVR
jgi:dUTP pyrophosphatase